MYSSALPTAATRGGPAARPGYDPKLDPPNGRRFDLVDPEEIQAWERTAPRHVGKADWERFEGYMAELFQAFGMDLATPGTQRTPERYLKALFESTPGYEGDPKLLPTFPTHCPGGPYCLPAPLPERP